MAPRHVLLTVGDSHGHEYGALRDLEDEIVRVTGAEIVEAPRWPAPRGLRDRLAHGTRWAPLRRFVPRRGGFEVAADVLWLVLMGPESSWLDLYRAWDRRVGFRIVYVFDTFAAQLPSLRRLCAAARWDLAVTSFAGAAPMLERETGRAWKSVPQGVKLDRFAPTDARAIAISSYGRRVPRVHEALADFARGRALHYDFSTAGALARDVSVRDAYAQYAWRLRSSAFTVSWPVELTHPRRAGDLSPITCRWFEAAAAGTPILGRAPRDPLFADLFGDDAVIPLEPSPRSSADTLEAIAAAWSRRDDHLRAAAARRATRAPRWSWESRVHEILTLARL